MEVQQLRGLHAAASGNNSDGWRWAVRRVCGCWREQCGGGVNYVPRLHAQQQLWAAAGLESTISEIEDDGFDRRMDLVGSALLNFEGCAEAGRFRQIGGLCHREVWL